MEKKKNNRIKNPKQLLSIMKAAAMGDMCFSHMLGFLKVGMTEITAANEIEKTLRGLGATDLAFPTICVSGERTNQPHGEPSEKTIEEGDFVILDFGAVYEGYCADMTRTVVMGRVSGFQKEIYGIVLSAQLAALEACKAGVRCVDVDRVARDIIAAAGYGEEFCHGTGHGVGALVHEWPRLNQKSRATLKENMAVTIEPGIYIPGEFGVRIEDLAIVTKFGIINTVKSVKELIIIK